MVKRSKPGRVVLVTGASTGLGLATTVHLARLGLHVYAGVYESKEKSVFNGVRAAERIHPVDLDVTRDDMVRQVVDRILEEKEDLYGLVNNAGIRIRGCFEDLAEGEIRSIFETNLFGTMKMTRAVLPHLKSRGEGRIVIVSSVAGRIGSFGVSAYCASKYALEGFAESLYQEALPFGVRVSLVEPGIIGTEAWTRHRRVGGRALDPSSPYARWFQNYEALADRMVITSSTRPHHVAEAVAKALLLSKPGFRYVVGKRAKVVLALRRLLPGQLFEKTYFPILVRKVVKGDG